MNYCSYVFSVSEINTLNTSELKKEIISLSKDKEYLLLGFKNVKNIDSSGMVLLLQLRHIFLDKIFLFDFVESTYELFEITNIIFLFNVFKDEKGAVDAISKKY